MIKLIIASIIIIPLIGVGTYFAMQVERLEFQSVCEKGHKRYTKLCKNVGKRAYSQVSVININEKNYGPILGVAWRKKGSIISSQSHKKKRRAENNSYYYIIGSNSKKGAQFLRIVSEIDPR